MMEHKDNRETGNRKPTKSRPYDKKKRRGTSTVQLLRVFYNSRWLKSRLLTFLSLPWVPSDNLGTTSFHVERLPDFWIRPIRREQLPFLPSLPSWHNRGVSLTKIHSIVPMCVHLYESTISQLLNLSMTCVMQCNQSKVTNLNDIKIILKHTL